MSSFTELWCFQIYRRNIRPYYRQSDGGYVWCSFHRYVLIPRTFPCLLLASAPTWPWKKIAWINLFCAVVAHTSTRLSRFLLVTPFVMFAKGVYNGVLGVEVREIEVPLYGKRIVRIKFLVLKMPIWHLKNKMRIEFSLTFPCQLDKECGKDKFAPEF